MLFKRFARSPRELDALAAYAQWADQYPTHAHNPLMRAEERTVLELMPEVRGRNALDLACGTGRYSRILRERGARFVVGVDLSPEMLGRVTDQTATFAQADLLHLPITNYFFDLIVCGLAIGHVENLTRAVAEMARALKRGGVIVYSDFHPLLYLAGARREFNGHDGKRYAVKHFPHLYTEHVAATRAAGLTITAGREPRIGIEIQEEFAESRRVYARWNGFPAVLVIRAEKI